MTFYSFEAEAINGKKINMDQYRGQVILVVNTASRCGFTPQLAGLEELYRKYKDYGFAVLGFPCNQFGYQEPGNHDEITDFCEVNYGVTFPMMSKISVKGDDQHPLYKWLTSKSDNGLEDSKVSWNFQKYMIDEEGRLVGHVPPRKKPHTKEIMEWLGES